MKKTIFPTLQKFLATRLLWMLLACLLPWPPSGMQAVASLSEISLVSCLAEDFNVKISHKAFPFGLFSRILTVVKEKCELTIDYESHRFIKKKWVIDVCREPVHIKVGAYSVEVLKRVSACSTEMPEGASATYCKTVQQIKQLLQDDGLVFAQGEKEDLLSEHGRIYCAYALLSKYLDHAEILSRYYGPGSYQSPQPPAAPATETEQPPPAGELKPLAPQPRAL